MSKPANFAEFVNANMIQRGDTRNEIRVRLLDRNGSPIITTNEIILWSGSQGSDLVVPGRQAIKYPNGEVGIKFLSTDVMRKGPLYLQFMIDWSPTLTERVPARNDLFLVIT